MSPGEFINLALEAGLSITPPRSGQYDGGRVGCDVVGLMRFAALIAAHEREQCAQIVIDIANADAGNPYKQALRLGSEAIRARGKA